MAMRVYEGGRPAANRGHSVPNSARGGGHRGGEQVVPFGGGGDLFGGGGLFGGGDPFKEFGADPFGGGAMQRFDEMAQSMMRGMPSGGLGGGMMGGPGGGMMGGNGQYSCQTFAMSSVRGADGKMHTERFASSDVGNRAHGIREAQQAYSNSTTGVDKMGLERQLGDRARKMVKERNRSTAEERSTEMYRGMDESAAGAFEHDFSSNAHHMPQHMRHGADMFAIGGPGSRGGNVASIRDGGGHGVRHRSQPSSRRV
eukprot:TRINITY_DN30444_c0_g1_i1.p1 TRINITY_DN30444_c0_g1~~TRINITY_DN30444_c0_g1_i1.p1  ORF type:complete len:277 (-),score=40.57 TRINITY_DN30444_c0_g1_i1:85-852(-)